MTNVERVHCGLSSNSSCPSCGCCYESILHILRDCPPDDVFGSLSFLSRIIWLSLVPFWNPGSFLFLRLLEALGLTPIPGLVYSYLFCGSFGSKGMISFLLVTVSLYLTVIGFVLHGLPTLRKSSLFSRLPYNIFSFPERLGVIGGVLRDSSGEWIKGYCKSIGIVSSLHVELWSILVGVRMAWSIGVSRLHVQSNSSVAVRMLRNPMAMTSPLPLVSAIALFSACDWCDFTWVPREQNMVANSMSKLLPSLDYHLAIYDVVPEVIQPLLVCDRDGPPYCR
ncbi:hypothetical protein V6N12_034530 [Hibiscus sabdariffa]|uniref:RNase H type-1 domain-containing protein n=1 Tax=Hibiscus sabdariffa TaxID=183260 RepID=A0ABR2DKC5_9ROSI